MYAVVNGDQAVLICSNDRFVVAAGELLAMFLRIESRTKRWHTAGPLPVAQRGDRQRHRCAVGRGYVRLVFPVRAYLQLVSATAR